MPSKKHECEKVRLGGCSLTFHANTCAAVFKLQWNACREFVERFKWKYCSFYVGIRLILRISNFQQKKNIMYVF